MGKRKKSSRKPQGPKKKEPLPTTFQCLFCNHEKSVTARIDKKLGIGMLSCKVCGQTHQCEINYLSAPVDVYYDWVDAAEAVNNPSSSHGVPAPAARLAEYRDHDTTGGRTTTSSGRKDEEEDDLDGFVENDEGDMEAEYTGDVGDDDLDE